MLNAVGNGSNAWIRIAEVQSQQLNVQFIRLLSLNVIFCSSNGLKKAPKKNRKTTFYSLVGDGGRVMGYALRAALHLAISDSARSTICTRTSCKYYNTAPAQILYCPTWPIVSPGLS